MPRSRLVISAPVKGFMQAVCEELLECDLRLHPPRGWCDSSSQSVILRCWYLALVNASSSSCQLSDSNSQFPYPASSPLLWTAGPLWDLCWVALQHWAPC